ncbi:hypothetical protein O5623_00705 [Escherichia coli]|nr:hypothetical protein [Escherichia coli]
MSDTVKKTGKSTPPGENTFIAKGDNYLEKRRQIMIDSNAKHAIDPDAILQLPVLAKTTRYG